MDCFLESLGEMLSEATRLIEFSVENLLSSLQELSEKPVSSGRGGCQDEEMVRLNIQIKHPYSP